MQGKSLSQTQTCQLFTDTCYHANIEQENQQWLRNCKLINCNLLCHRAAGPASSQPQQAWVRYCWPTRPAGSPWPSRTLWREWFPWPCWITRTSWSEGSTWATGSQRTQRWAEWPSSVNITMKVYLPFTFDLQAIRVIKGTEDPQREDLKESPESRVYQVRNVYPSGVPGWTGAVVNFDSFFQVNPVELLTAKTDVMESGDPVEWMVQSAFLGPPAPPVWTLTVSQHSASCQWWRRRCQPKTPAWRAPVRCEGWATVERWELENVSIRHLFKVPHFVILKPFIVFLKWLNSLTPQIWSF